MTLQEEGNQGAEFDRQRGAGRLRRRVTDYLKRGSESGQGGMVPGDIEQARVHKNDHTDNGILFPADEVRGRELRPRDVCSRLGLSWFAAQKLFQDDWISFDPDKTDWLSPSEEAELVFVGSLVVAGCDTEMLTDLLSELPKPYAYRMDTVFYDWLARSWEILPRYEHFRDLFQEWLEDLVDSGQIRKLRELRDRLDHAIRNLHRMTPW